MLDEEEDCIAIAAEHTDECNNAVDGADAMKAPVVDDVALCYHQ